jgi:hypothetical protein
MRWFFPLCEEVKTLEGACEIVMPEFKKVVERLKKRA